MNFVLDILLLLGALYTVAWAKNTLWACLRLSVAAFIILLHWPWITLSQQWPTTKSLPWIPFYNSNLGSHFWNNDIGSHCCNSDLWYHSLFWCHCWICYSLCCTVDVVALILFTLMILNRTGALSAQPLSLYRFLFFKFLKGEMLQFYSCMFNPVWCIKL